MLMPLHIPTSDVVTMREPVETGLLAPTREEVQLLLAGLYLLAQQTKNEEELRRINALEVRLSKQFT